ncbi:hypothetical protein PGTUg99_017909 [Puccinia graminis f. sp. tritici]|uniref:Uncharacterized protein n=1 Tax=Puccinia graminis f. sp. tritici TaxID=56615 RepID=A0A5B0Q146_PUCGR|nr:hypothetical protein PGTUg99_017909 [Puccinia graminis f. sp. tritici]
MPFPPYLRDAPRVKQLVTKQARKVATHLVQTILQWIPWNLEARIQRQGHARD